jgi:hypothetical protein
LNKYYLKAEVIVMARSTKNAFQICLVSTLIAAAGAALGIYLKIPLIIIFALLPAVVYEVYRTEGISTIWASWGILAALVIEAVLIIGKININVSKYAHKYIPAVPDIDITLGIPLLIAFFSTLLIRRTAGIYTKWLAVVILLGTVTLFYAIDPGLFEKFTGTELKEHINRINAK